MSIVKILKMDFLFRIKITNSSLMDIEAYQALGFADSLRTLQHNAVGVKNTYEKLTGRGTLFSSEIEIMVVEKSGRTQIEIFFFRRQKIALIIAIFLSLLTFLLVKKWQDIIWPIFTYSFILLIFCPTFFERYQLLKAIRKMGIS